MKCNDLTESHLENMSEDVYIKIHFQNKFVGSLSARSASEKVAMYHGLRFGQLGEQIAKIVETE